MNAARLMLALETSQRKSSVALGAVAPGGGADEIFSESIDTRDRLVEDALPAAQRLCARAGASPHNLGAVALNAGPGGFTGLRIAHAAAQAIAESLSIPLVQVFAAIVAREAAVLAGRVQPGQTAWVALVAKDDGCWMAKVSGAAQELGEHEDAGVRSIEQWPLRDGEALIADEHLPASWRERAERSKISIVPLEPTAEAVLRAGRRLLARGRTTAPELALPVYPREAEAVRLWRERHGTA
ncbi:MAG: tRNA (adenosine(37)-N6)-threonylcarbamoyltransferase complex dimerization subunit type 1 TsaB [Planctomycetes bacterium]|nr:tRNA (adenosine(37)-N6)-threonylcarbamoyltransferase complex dimerization subunit type 1 TsaB [Planctomycetota bacterium]